jgi:hypothetical protein
LVLIQPASKEAGFFVCESSAAGRYSDGRSNQESVTKSEIEGSIYEIRTRQTKAVLLVDFGSPSVLKNITFLRHRRRGDGPTTLTADCEHATALKKTKELVP